MKEGGEVLPQASEPMEGPASERPDQMLQRARARLGTTFHDKWRLDTVLGIGGMATVYAATHRNGSRAAVKILHSELSLDQFVRQRFLWEGRVANAVGHEGVVHVLDDDTAQDGSLFLVTELLEGETLEQHRMRRGGQLDQREVLKLVDRLLDVLAAVHTQQIVHRDLKPENVFLTHAGQVKVLDFGIARLRELSTPSSITQAGLTVGTPAFMAPEQARGLSNDVDALSDIWACGALMYHLLSGQYVHEGRTLNEQLLHAMTKPAPRLATVAPHIAAPIRKIVDRALAFAKNMRWPDARTMQEAVRQAYVELYGSAITTDRIILSDDPFRSAMRSATEPPATAELNTSPPVERLRSITMLLRFARPWPAAAAGAALLVLTIVFLMAGRSSAPANASPSAAPMQAAAGPRKPSPDPTSETRWTPDPPEVAATDLPVAIDPPSETLGRRTALPSPVDSLGNTVGKADCHPPYVVDATTGKKHWKLECL